MKKVLLLSAFTFILLHADIIAQPLPNGGFETWNNTPFYELNSWYGGNMKSAARMGVVPITRVTGQSGYAVRIQTFAANSDTSDSYISNSMAGDPSKGEGGVPFSDMPTAFTGYYRYNLPGYDSAGVLVFFKKNGVVFSQNLFLIRGTGNQSTFTSFSYPLSLPYAPDSVIIAATSSNLISGVGIENGSFLELDQIGFTGSTQTIPNGDFEGWTMSGYEAPAGWEVQGNNVTKTTDKYSGLYAIKMVTSLSGDGMVNSSGITTGHNGQFSTVGGRPYTLMVDTLVGYYKYITSGVDTGDIFVSLSKNSAGVGGGGMQLLPASNYTYFSIPFSAFTQPDTMQINAYSSGYPLSPSALGSTLYLDGLALKSQLTGIFGPSDNSLEMIAYPNPANDVLNIEFRKSFTGVASVSLYDVSGRLVKEAAIENNLNRFQLNIADLSQGIYHYQVMNSEGIVWKQFVKE